MRSGNFFEDVDINQKTEQFSEILRAPGVRIERIVSNGQTTPDDDWYDQDWTEWVLVLQGHAKIICEGETEPQDLRAGDWLEIKPNVRHRVTYTDLGGPTIWLAIHCGEDVA